MTKIKYAIAVYFFVISAVSIFVTAYDKKISKIKGHRRVPERTLLLLSALGGGPAMLITMTLIRHKTKHPKFMIGIPAIIIAEYLAFLAIYNYFR